ncbi:DUF3710 domain-containing protein [Gulosibacter molinativorax]|uniref:DUF3710 domain-containing protein n=1 Tax=Gulosibacter molinativorax TaxID=256821 RepID=A0ABT7C5S8_9MICO|nr:DUF3710 domain-containing protein [Gulosibacter molinativorax]MDJ1370453.1 DUF3710 domain-containing protein [Gulosibacter molinativorax]QUY61366.1 Hypotetical protein [Gulosibacter molinativorax]
MGLFDIFKRKEETIKADRLVVEDEDAEATAEEAEAVEEEDFEDFAKEAPEDRAENGPFDRGEIEAEGAYLDLGALRIPMREGLALRLEFEDKTQRVIAVGLDYEGSTMQVQAFASPRSSGLWRDVRTKLAAQVKKQGGRAEEKVAEVGTMLRTSVPIVQGSDKLRVVQFLGVDGPRWFLRGVVSGQATSDEAKLEQMIEIFRGVIVDRGDRPVPPRDLLALTVPEAMANQMAASAAQQRAQRTAMAAKQREQQAGQ